jgi:hypothetical protein
MSFFPDLRVKWPEYLLRVGSTVNQMQIIGGGVAPPGQDYTRSRNLKQGNVRVLTIF